jgi:pimeloyl-ACP methyl ester carboxylesterase
MRLVANMDAIANDPAVAKLIGKDPLGGGRVVPARFLRSWLDYVPEGRPEASKLPVLLVHPAEDRWTPSALSVRFLDRLGGRTRAVLLERCGHFPLEEPGLTRFEAEFANFTQAVLSGEVERVGRRSDPGAAVPLVVPAADGVGEGA